MKWSFLLLKLCFQFSVLGFADKLSQPVHKVRNLVLVELEVSHEQMVPITSNGFPPKDDDGPVLGSGAALDEVVALSVKPSYHVRGLDGLTGRIFPIIQGLVVEGEVSLFQGIYLMAP